MRPPLCAGMGGCHGDMESRLLVGKCCKSCPWLLRKGRNNTVFKPAMVQQAGRATRCSSGLHGSQLLSICSGEHGADFPVKAQVETCVTSYATIWQNQGLTGPVHIYIYTHVCVYIYTYILMLSRSEERFKQNEEELGASCAAPGLCNPSLCYSVPFPVLLWFV